MRGQFRLLLPAVNISATPSSVGVEPLIALYAFTQF